VGEGVVDRLEAADFESAVPGPFNGLGRRDLKNM
jgi:hypothetical protein